MRRLLALGVMRAMLAAAAPANAKRNRPPKPPGQATLDVTMTANLWSVNIPGDDVVYSIAVTNKGSENLDPDVELTAGAGPVTVTLERISNGEILKPGDTWEYTWTYRVDSSDIASEEVVATATATNTNPPETATATAAVSVWPTAECQWTGGVLESSSMSEAGVPCSWIAEPGYWTLTATATSARKSTRVILTMRDHFPGNWCAVPPQDSDYWDTGILDGFLESSGATSGRVKGDDTLTLYVYFPETRTLISQAEGICLSGGAGGETMGVGTIGTYYLMAAGDATVMRTRGG